MRLTSSQKSLWNRQINQRIAIRGSTPDRNKIAFCLPALCGDTSKFSFGLLLAESRGPSNGMQPIKHKATQIKGVITNQEPNFIEKRKTR